MIINLNVTSSVPLLECFSDRRWCFLFLLAYRQGKLSSRVTHDVSLRCSSTALRHSGQQCRLNVTIRLCSADTRY
jgi:hypothetical protein